MPTTHQLRRTLSGTVAILLTAVLPLSLNVGVAQADKSPAAKRPGSVLTLAEKHRTANLLPGRGNQLALGKQAVRPSAPRAAAEDGYGSISGTVADSDGNAVEGAEVWAYSRSEDDWIDSSVTDAAGAYEIADLDPGYYTLEIDAPSDSPLAGEWWNDRTTYTSATYFHVSGGQGVYGKDVTLIVGGSVSGTVVDADGEALVSATVWAADTHGKSATTGADGSYTIVGVAPGKQTLGFDGPEGDSLATEWWNDKPYYDKADFFTVTAGGVIRGKDATLTDGGSIDGQVYDYFFDEGADEVPVHVLVYDRGWHYVAETETDEDGNFGVANLRSGLAYAVVPDDYWVSTDATGEGVGLVFVDSKGKPRAVVNPKLSGSPQVGSTLSLSRGSGSWSGVNSSYVWLADGEEIGASRTSYRLTSDDLGISFSAQVTASWNRDTMTSTSLPTGGVVLAGTPVVKGTPTVGRDVWVDTGTWTEGTDFDYQWYADGKPLPDASDADLAVPPTAAGHRLTVSVTGHLEDHATLTKTSAATARVMLATAPVVTGARAVGFTLGVIRGAWTSKTAFSYQWLRDGQPIAKATNSTYKATATDTGTILTVRVTGKRSGYSSAVRASAAGGLVTTAAVPSIDGTAAVLSTLTAVPGAWAGGTDFGYQWYADGKAIDTANGQKFTVQPAYAGKRLSVRVTGTRPSYATVALTSAQTAKVMLAGTPRISGDLTIGSALTVDRGMWTAKTAFRYQWLRDDAPIRKATKSGYRTTAADAGHALSVVVIGKRPGYATVTLTSAPVTLP